MKIDSEGRSVFIFCFLGDVPYILINVYTPPPFKIEVIKEVLDFIADKPRVPLLVVGDFNMVLNTQIYRFHIGKIGAQEG